MSPFTISESCHAWRLLSSRCLYFIHVVRSLSNLFKLVPMHCNDRTTKLLTANRYLKKSFYFLSILRHFWQNSKISTSDYMSLAISWLWWPHMETRISSQYAHQGGLMGPVLTNQRPGRGWSDQSEARQFCVTIRGRCYAYNGPITGVFLPPHSSLSLSLSLSWCGLLHPRLWIQSDPRPCLSGSGSLSVSNFRLNNCSMTKC